MNTKYARILEPVTVGGVTLRNRMVMGAMHTRLETLDRPTERLSAFFAARAAGEIGLILTNGFSPNMEGRLEADSDVLDDSSDLDQHRAVCEAVHESGGRIALQILHAGRYAKHDLVVGPSQIKARINPFAPRPMSADDVYRTIDDFVRTTELAKAAGYDGVEIMGSEGYLINEFVAAATNTRTDEFGGDFESRCRFPVEIMRRTREAVGSDFLLIYRISAIDLVDDGLTGAEVADLARMVEAAGADVINSGIGWHESSVPTIAASIPRAVWTFAIRNVTEAVTVPVIASNRINDPDVAEDLLRTGVADMVSMARPLLADPDFALKVREDRVDEINTCIACNQACLDRIFTDRPATCMVNPRAGREIEFIAAAPARRKRVAVVGAGPAGLAFAVNAAEQGHDVTLYEAATEIGGQINLARQVPGKTEFNQMLRYFRVQLSKLAVTMHLGSRVTAEQLAEQRFDEIVLATGVNPRVPTIPGIEDPIVMSYAEVLAGQRTPGRRVAVIGAGGIGFDVCEYMLGDPEESLEPEAFMLAWSVDGKLATAGGLTGVPRSGAPVPDREITLFQRSVGRVGHSLGKSTGWILKQRLSKAGVKMVAGATYEAITPQGLQYSVDGRSHLLEVDSVVICAGQESDRSLYEELSGLGIGARLIGGADVAAELDAVRAIEQATRLALAL